MPSAPSGPGISNEPALKVADGEPDSAEPVAAELERRLTGSGAVVLHGLRFLGFGAIDHVIIGRGGITVIAVEDWPGEVQIRGTSPYVDGWNKHSEVEQLERERDGVRIALCHAPPALRGTGVQAVMCLAREPERSRARLGAGGLWLGGCGAAADVARRDGVLTGEDIAQLRDTLVAELPRVSREQLDGAAAPGAPAVTIAPGGAVAAVPATGSRRAAAHSRGGPGAGARSVSGASESGPAARARWRANRVLAAYLTGVIAVAAIAAGIAFSHQNSLTILPTATVSHLHVAAHGGHAVVRFTAPANAKVRFRLTGAGRPRHVRLTATGAPQTWHGPRVSGRRPALTVEACAVDSAGHCEHHAVRATS